MSSEGFRTADAESAGDEKQPESASVSPVPEPTINIPDGGFQAWATVVGSFMIMFCSLGYASSFGVYQDYYVRAYLPNSSASAISWIGSVNLFIILSGGFIAGRLHDRGYFYFLMYGGSLLMALSLFMLSLARPGQLYQVFLAQGVANGIGAAMAYVPCMAVVSHHFVKRRALAMTIVASGSSLGAVIHPIMLNHTLHSGLSFGNAVRASAGLISGLLLIACLLMRTRLPPAKQGLNFLQSARKCGRDPIYIIGAFGMTIFTTGYYYAPFYIQLDSVQHGIDSTFAFNVLVIMNAASFVGRVVPGFLSRSLGVKLMVTVGSGCGTVLIFAMIAIGSLASVVTISVIYGLTAGSVATLMGPLFAVLTDDMSELGTRMGIAFSASGLGILIGPPIDGLLLTNDFIWWRPAVFSGVMAGVGFCCFLAVLVLHRPKKTDAAELASDAPIDLEQAPIVFEPATQLEFPPAPKGDLGP
ncbi:major facilitator superfamily domain-containing protein [Mycena vitilis]|nr:major facilitator superfamily domain-containing protein [Mycena vitilis]